MGSGGDGRLPDWQQLISDLYRQCAYPFKLLKPIRRLQALFQARDVNDARKWNTNGREEYGTVASLKLALPSILPRREDDRRYRVAEGVGPRREREWACMLSRGTRSIRLRNLPANQSLMFPDTSSPLPNICSPASTAPMRTNALYT